MLQADDDVTNFVEKNWNAQSPELILDQARRLGREGRQNASLIREKHDLIAKGLAALKEVVDSALDD